MKKINELILHCLDQRSDKVYIFEIFQKADFYFLSTSWGKRECNSLATQLKGRFSTLTAVTNEMNRLANRKKKKGYQKAKFDIKIPGHVVLEHHEDVHTSSSVAIEAHADAGIGKDRFGNYLRRII